MSKRWVVAVMALALAGTLAGCKQQGENENVNADTTAIGGGDTVITTTTTETTTDTIHNDTTTADTARADSTRH